MRRYLFLLVFFLGTASSWSWPLRSVCECQRDSKTIPASPGDPSFVTARKERVACFLRARAMALSGTMTSCDVELEADIASDVTDLTASRRDLTDLLDAARTPTQERLLRDQIAQINEALKAEQSYVTPATKEAKPQPCDCPVPLTDIERDLSRTPGDERFYQGIDDLSECLTLLRQTAMDHYEDKNNAECHEEPCNTTIDAVEKLVVAETKSLVSQRDSVAKDFATRNKRDENHLVKQLHAIKDALATLQPYVTIAGTDVTIKEGDFQARRKAHEATHSDALQEKTCVDRYAYLDIPAEPDPKGLIDCVDRMRKMCRTAPLNKKSCEVVVNVSVQDCELDLSRLEQKLREYAGSQFDQLNKLKAAHEALSINDKKENDDEQKAIKDRLAEIRKREVIPDEGDLAEYSDYKQWWSKFSAGFEYVSLNHALTKGFPRIGATIGLNLPRQAVPDVSLRNWHPKSYGLFTTFTIGLTNTAEETNTTLPGTPAGTAQPVAASNATTPAGAKNALAVEEQIFWPWWRSDLNPQDRRLRTWLGLVVAGGGHKADTDNFLATRLYGGFRFARSPEMYSDWMYGRSSELRSGRLEVRGQFPIIRFQNHSRLVLGGIGNFGVDRRKRHGICASDSSGTIDPTKQCDELDSIRFYLTYDVTSDSLMKIFGGTK